MHIFKSYLKISYKMIFSRIFSQYTIIMEARVVVRTQTLVHEDTLTKSAFTMISEFKYICQITVKTSFVFVYCLEFVFQRSYFHETISFWKKKKNYNNNILKYVCNVLLILVIYYSNNWGIIRCGWYKVSKTCCNILSNLE